MQPDTPETPRAPGWYRVTGKEWQPISDEEADAAIAGGAIDLVLVEGIEDVPLW